MDPDFDYIVVGGGSAGCVLAGRLTEDPGVRVALLEAGPPDRSALIHCPAGIALLARTRQANWDFHTLPQPGLGGRRGWSPRGKVLGGSSSVNAMVYTRGHRTDYDHWAALGNPGWSYDDVLPVFRAAEHNERGADDWHGADGPLNVADLRAPNPIAEAFIAAAMQAGHRRNVDFNGAEQEGVGWYQVTHRGGERFSAAKAYLAPHRGRSNLEVVTSAHATRVLFDGRRATGLEFVKDGHRQRMQARREVLLAAGALQSPQLLMLSGVGPGAELARHGIAVRHDLPGVGRNFHDHVDVVQVVTAPGLVDSIGVSLRGLARVVRGIGQWRRERDGILTTNFAEAGGFIRSHASEEIPDLQLHLVIAKLVDHGRRTVLGHGYSCHVCLLRPRSRGSVALASADPMVAPLIDPNFFGDPDDLPRLVRGFRKVREILEQPALRALGGHEHPTSAGARTDAEIESFIRRYADTIYHPVGSCRMGPDAMSVVDASLRVHGLEGLRVVDASIMPRVVGGNTNAPVIMVAEKAARMIRAEWPAAAPRTANASSPGPQAAPVG